MPIILVALMTLAVRRVGLPASKRVELVKSRPEARSRKPGADKLQHAARIPAHRRRPGRAIPTTARRSTRGGLRWPRRPSAWAWTPSRLVYLVDAPAEGDKKVTGRATREEVTKALERFAARGRRRRRRVRDADRPRQPGAAPPSSTCRGPTWGRRSSTPLLAKLKSRQVVFVNTASASGPFVEALSGPGRTIVTATRNGAEQYATLFGGHFVEALNSEAADADKNKRVSVLEAFLFAKAEVAQAYEREGLLATEHAHPGRQRRQGRQPGPRRHRQGRQGGDHRLAGHGRQGRSAHRAEAAGAATWSAANWSAASRRIVC